MNTTGNMTRVALAAVAALLAQTTPAGVVAQPDAWLDYIEADGSQFIDTGVAAMTGVKARLDIAWTKASSDGLRPKVEEDGSVVACSVAACSVAAGSWARAGKA